MNKKILNLAIPNIISNITIPLLGMVDLAITGHLDQSYYIGAIAVGSMIFNLIYWAFAFLRMGVSGLTAQAYGAKNNPLIFANFARGLLVALAAGFLVITLQVPIEKLVFSLIDSSAEVSFYAQKYFYIRIWAAPATIGLYALTGWFIGMQDTKTPMAVSIGINIVNIGLSYFFVAGLGMDTNGVALGTLCAQYLGFITALILLLRRYGYIFKFADKASLLNRSELKNFFLVNRDIFLRTMSLLAVFTFFTSRSASENDNILAANSLLLQFLFIFSFLTDGFAYAAEALAGRFYGARDATSYKQLMKLSFYWGFGMSVLFTLAYLFFGNAMLRLMTDQAQVLEVSKVYRFWIYILPVASILSFVWDGIYIGITASKHMRNSMLIAVFAVFFPVWYFTHQQLGNHALWLAFILFLLTRGVAQTFIYQFTIRKQVQKVFQHD